MNSMQGKPKKEMFKVFHFLHKKTYSLDSKEGISRYNIFKANMKWMQEKNSKLGKQVYGITQFMDVTDEEFKKVYLMDPVAMKNQFNTFAGKKVEKKTVENNEAKKFNFMDSEDEEEVTIPLNQSKNIDWRHILLPAKDQKSCGSCWAFAAMAAVEGALNLYQKKKLDLSEQYLVDCDTNDSGCEGGWPTRTFDWLMSNGVVEQKQAEYTNSQTLCKVSSFESKRQNLVKGFQSCEKDVAGKECTRQKWIDLLSKGPVIVAMDASDAGFSKYKPVNEAAWVPAKCDKVNHAVTAVGFVTENGADYLIVRNSWGTNWGINGHFKVPADKHCGILDFAWLPETQEHKPFPVKECPTFYSECGFKGKSVSTCDGVLNFNTTIGGKVEGLKVDDKNDNRLYFNLFTQPECRGEAEWNYESFECTNDHWSYKDKTFVSASPDSANLPWGCIQHYDKPCFSGNRTVLCNSIPDLTKTGFSFTAGSIYIFGYTVKSVVLFENVDYQGAAFGIKNASVYNTKDVAGLQEIFAKAKSVLIIPKAMGEQ